MMKALETALMGANLGVSVSSDGSNIRVVFPELSSERRTMLAKILKGKLEEARIRVRKERDEIWSDIQTKEREGVISEDDKFRDKDALQKVIDEQVARLEATAQKKEKDISE